AGIGGLSAALDVAPLPAFAATAAALIAVGLVAGPRMVIPPAPPEPGPRPGDAPPRSPAQITLVIWVLGLLALFAQVGEGAAGGWRGGLLDGHLGTCGRVAGAA